MSSSREQQLEHQVSQQEDELRRLHEELQRLKQSVDSASNGNAASGGASSAPQAPLPHQHTGGSGKHAIETSSASKKARYLFGSFPATLLSPPLNGPQLYPCEGHSAVAHEGRTILFGGTNGSTITNDTVAFNIATGRWRRMVPSGASASQNPHALPTPRYGHSAVVYKSSMIIYGGFGPGGVRSASTTAAATAQPADHAAAANASMIKPPGLLSSMHAMDLHTGDWTALPPSAAAASAANAAASVEGQMACKNHSAVVVLNKMYVFGGCLVEGRTNAVRCYDLERHQWLPTDTLNQQAVELNGLVRGTGSVTPSALLAQSDVPAPRSGHSAAVYVKHGQASMVIFGGRLSKYQFCSDVFRYDLNTHRWVRLYCGGDTPLSRCDHSSVLYRDHLVVYGGYAVQEGGKKRYFADMHALDLVSCTWSRVDVTGPMKPLGSCGHASILFETTDNVVCMAAVGGWGQVPEPVSLADEEAERILKQHDGDVSYRTINDVWVFQIAKAPEPTATGHGTSGQHSAAAGTASATGFRPLNRPTSASTGRPMSPRQPSPRTRPSTARSARPQSARSTSGRGRPAFVTQAAKAATAKLFGDAPVSPRIDKMRSGSPKRSEEDLSSIYARLTSTRVHDAEMERLRKQHLKEKEMHPLTPEEQQDITDRLFYQQILIAEERRKALESKYLATQEKEHVLEEQIQEVVSRLHQPIERPELQPPRPPKVISKVQEGVLLQKLYQDDAKHRMEHIESLEKKYLWGPAAPKKSASEIEASLQRLTAPLSSRSKR